MNIGLGFLIGCILGSLIDCISERSLTDKSFWGRSYCLRCKKTLKWYDLFPLISYIVLRGRCRNCKTKIPFETFLIELLAGIFSAIIFVKVLPTDFFTTFLQAPSNSLIIFLGLLLKEYVFSILFIVVITDLKKGIIPDRISLPAILTILIFSLVFCLVQVSVLYLSLNSSEIGKLLLPPHSDFLYRHAVIIMTPFINSFFAAIAIALFFGTLIIVTRGRGMGGGDLKLGVFMGLALGFPNALLALLLSFILGSLAGIVLILIRRKNFGQTIPFGPFLSLGSMIALLWGNELIDWYFRIRVF